jgi:replicative DNA helicase
MTTPVKFDQEFKDKTLALNLRDQNFCERVDGLLAQDFYDTEVDRYILGVIHGHYKKFNCPPSHVALIHTFREDATSKVLRSEVVADVSKKIKELYTVDISDREFIVGKVADFVRKQATVNAISKACDIIDADGDVNSILPIMQKAIDVGTTDMASSYDYNDGLEQRIEIRKARLKGELAHNSVTTGFKRFNETLYRQGWGKGELSIYMAPAKAGKSVALMDHAIKAAEAGYNVLFVSLEVSTEIQADRMDSNVSGVKLKEISIHLDKVEERVKKWRDRVTGKLKLHEYPAGTYKVSDLRRLIKKYQALGTQFDMVVLDYADIMLTESNSSETIDKSKQIFIDLRALAQQENLAMLTAIQTNRLGAAVERIEAIHVAEDFNKIRIADLVISINANELEKDAGEARLYFAASRNQEAVTITVKRDMSCMKHIKEVLNVR